MHPVESLKLHPSAKRELSETTADQESKDIPMWMEGKYRELMWEQGGLLREWNKMRLGVRALNGSPGAQRLIHSTFDSHTIYSRQYAKKWGHSVNHTELKLHFSGEAANL